MHTFAWLRVEPETLWKGRRGGGENWEFLASPCVGGKALCLNVGGVGLEQGGLQEQGGCGENARAAEGSTKSE